MRWKCTLNEVFVLHKFPKRQAALEHTINQMSHPAKRSTLADQCRTCWVARHDSFHVFGKLYSAVVEILEAIVSSGSQAWNTDTLAVARSLMLDQLIYEMDTRFSSTQHKAILRLSL